MGDRTVGERTLGESSPGDGSPGAGSPGASSPGDGAFGDGAAGSYASSANYRLELNGSHDGAVVFLHGLGGELSQLWGLTPGEVGGRPAPVLASDAREHGSTFTAGTAPLSFDAMAQDLTSLADDLQLGPKFVLVGVSMGAATALAVATKEPGRVHAPITSTGTDKLRTDSVP